MLVSQHDLEKVIAIAKDAGDAIMQVYQRDFVTEYKDNDSPLTEADLAAHQIIVEGLNKLTPKIPVISEESKALDWNLRRSWTTYWLVDPLDGTKEFIKKNGEFTVNIALIHEHTPVWGVVYAPAIRLNYFGGSLIGESFKEDQSVKAIRSHNVPKSAHGWKIAGSKSHQTPEFAEFIKRFESPVITNIGSSLKICMVADGQADLYPRLGLTSEWDTAAAHAVLLGAGGSLLNYETGSELKYNQKESLLNPFFIAAGVGYEFQR